MPRLMNDKAYGDQALNEFTGLLHQLNDTVAKLNRGRAPPPAALSRSRLIVARRGDRHHFLNRRQKCAATDRLAHMGIASGLEAFADGLVEHRGGERDNRRASRALRNLPIADLADGLTRRGHDVTLWAAPGSRVDAAIEPFGREGEWTRWSRH